MSDENDNKSGIQASLLASVVGLLVLGGFAAFIVYMLRNLGDSDTEWSRAMVLFGGVEAVAFAAAGYFFGTQVQRGKVEEAKNEAQSAEQVADAAKKEALAQKSAGKQFALRVKTELAPGGGGTLLGRSDAATNKSVQGLVDAADALLSE